MYRRLNYGLLVLATMLSMEPPGSRAFQLSVAGLQPFEAWQRPQQRLRVPLLPKLDMTGTQYVDKHFRSTTKRAHQQLERVFHKDGTTWGSPSNAGPEPLNGHAVLALLPQGVPRALDGGQDGVSHV